MPAPARSLKFDACLDPTCVHHLIFLLMPVCKNGAGSALESNKTGRVNRLFVLGGTVNFIVSRAMRVLYVVTPVDKTIML